MGDDSIDMGDDSVDTGDDSIDRAYNSIDMGYLVALQPALPCRMVDGVVCCAVDERNPERRAVVDIDSPQARVL